MATLNIHKGGQNDLQGWSKTECINSNIIETIPDQVHSNTGAKIATSIPSPFARMILFDTAFKQVNIMGIEGSSPYHVLVSSVLDLLQLLFIHGNHPQIRIETFDLNGVINKLTSAKNQGNQYLGQALDGFRNNFPETDSFKFDRLSLFYYNDHLIGGTSPYTLVFTSPNWNPGKSGFDICTLDGQELFKNKLIPLKERDQHFILYLNRLIELNSTVFEQYLANFKNYVKETISALPESARAKVVEESSRYSKSLYDQNYISIGQKHVNLKVGSIVIKSYHSLEIQRDIRLNSGFRISSSVYSQPDQNETIPLALCEGDFDLKFIQGRWDPATIIPENLPADINDRILPGNINQKYPYLVPDDFFEKTLYRLPFNIDSDRFFTINDQDGLSFLIPIKREFFKHFTIEEFYKISSFEKKADNYVFRLSLPLVEGNNIVFTREYKKDEIENISEFEVGISPWYRVTDKSSVNDYTLLFVGDYSEFPSFDVRYYSFSDLESRIDFKKSERSSKDVNLIKEVHKINRSVFDVIEISISNQSNAIIIPKFKDISVQNSNRTINHYFGIDFGTSNTYVAHTTSRNNSQVGPFEFKKNEIVSFLSENGPFHSCETSFKREFCPSKIEDDYFASFPFKTALMEINSLPSEADPDVYLSGNLGFFFNNEVIVDGNYQYYTDVKWLMENDPTELAHRKRVKVFFKDIFKLIKHRILLDNGNLLNSSIIWFTPTSMLGQIRGLFKDLIIQAMDSVFHDYETKPALEYTEEAIAPYFSLKEEKGFGLGANILNIDIGGGTTDVIYFDNTPLGTKGISTSFKFAANNIWGDKLNTKTRDNGFTKLFNLSHIIDPDIQNSYRALCSRKTIDSSDICSFAFLHDSHIDFSGKIKFHGQLKILFALHYSALLYNIASFLKFNKKQQPDKITFTGKGSEYLKLLFSDNHQITLVTKILMETFFGEAPKSQFEVLFNENPKLLTANGGVYKLKLHGNIDVDSKNWLGIPPPSDSSEYSLAEIETISDKVFEEFNRFIGSFFNKRIIKTFANIGVDLESVENLKSIIEDYSDISFNNSRMQLTAAKNNNPNQPIADNLVLWPLKDTFYHLSKIIMK